MVIKPPLTKKNMIRSTLSGTAGLNNLKYVSKDYPTGINITNTQLSFNQKNAFAE